MHGSMLIGKNGWLNKLGVEEEGQVSLTGEFQTLGVDTPSGRWGLPPTPPHTLCGAAPPASTEQSLAHTAVNHAMEMDTPGNKSCASCTHVMRKVPGLCGILAKLTIPIQSGEKRWRNPNGGTI